MTVSPSRFGFTLIEVMVGLVLLSMIVMMVHSITSQISRANSAAATAMRTLDCSSNGRRWLKGAFLSSETGPDTGPFDGEPHRLSFDAWLQQPGGWFARRTIELEVEDSVFTARVGGDQSLRLRDSVGGVEFGYLLDQGGDSRWVGTWRSKLGTPSAVRITLERFGEDGNGDTDTLLFLLRARG